MDLLKIAESEKKYIVDLRREFHKYPELSLQEKETSKRIIRELDKMKIPYVIVGDYGIVATIEGKNKNQVVALRADMDALPIEEENDVPYKSVNKKVMHACGHDSHIAMLLGAAKLLNNVKSELNGSVKLCFQQAEELGIGGDLSILKELEKSKIKSVFAIHVWSGIPSGKVCITAGPMMAGCNFFSIEIQGKGSHGAVPHNGINPIIVACSIVQNINSARTYEINPADNLVISIGSIQSGMANNVIPDTALIKGSIRTFTKQNREQVFKLLERIAKNTAATFKASAKFNVESSVTPVINNEKTTAITRESLTKLLGSKGLYDFPKMYVSENFGSFTDKYPGTMAFVGCKNSEIGCNFMHHHPKFNIDEKALPIGSALYAQYTIDSLK